MHRYELDGAAYLGFPASYDVHGDGSVVVAHAGGHTPGSVVVFVALPSGERYGFTGMSQIELGRAVGMDKTTLTSELDRLSVAAERAEDEALRAFSSDEVARLRRMLFDLVGTTQDPGTCV